MPLFSDVTRTYSGPKDYAEPSFAYLDRSARPECERIRQVLEMWYADFPDNNGDLMAHFRSTRTVQFRGAAFEMYVHRLLSGLGYTISVHHGTDSETRTTPDFRVSDSHESTFYVEATLATDCSEAERAAEARKAIIYDSINRISCANFYLALDVKGDPSSAPPGRRLRASLQAWLESLDPDALLQHAADFESLPRLPWEHEGWKITFTAVPRSPERRGNPMLRTIGSMMPEAHWVAPWQSICNAVKAKGKRYGKLNEPLVVVVNVTSFHSDRIDEMDALFGQESYVFSRGDLKRGMRMVRKPNGVWNGPQGIRNKRISAVLIVRDMWPWSMTTSDVTLYFNPSADHPLSGSICKFNRAIPHENGQMAFVAGTHPREFLKLPERWPEID